jgi:lambda family phage portal protein
MMHKKKISVRLYEAIFPAKRSYAAAKVNRLNAGWTQYPTGARQERRDSLAILIARSREAARNYPHIVNYIRLMCENVIGPKSIQLQSRARRKNGKLNVPLNQRVEEAWWEWCHSETCTASGLLDWKGVQDLAVTQCETDGAFLIQLIEADNAFGFSLRMWDVTWLDLTFNENPAIGNRIIMSVEVDAFDKPVAYWLTQPQSEVNFGRPQTRQRVRVPAEQMIHGIRNWDSESQVHGVPGTAAALLAAKNVYSYCESVVMASRVAANQFGVLKNTSPDGMEQFTGAEDAEGNPQNPLINSSPLAITQLLPGWEMQQFKPEQPTQNHPAFKQTLDMEIAVALGVPYFLLMGNWEAVNFSSSRGGLGEFRERCKSYQTFIATTLCSRVFHAWLRSAWLSGKLELTDDEFREVQHPMWQGRGFDYIDPTKDINADVTKLQNRLTTPSEILAERGVDYLDFLERWASDRELAAQYGIDIEDIYTEQQPAAAQPAADPAAEPAKPAAKARDFTYANGNGNGKYSDEILN